MRYDLGEALCFNGVRVGLLVSARVCLNYGMQQCIQAGLSLWFNGNAFKANITNDLRRTL